MDKKERRWLYFLIAIFLIVNVITLSPLVPWQQWILWDKPEPVQTVNIEFENYQIHMEQPVKILKDEFVAFSASTSDVTYGFGVFRKDNSMVFQMNVIPGHENKIVWKFDEPGMYDVRSTEYSGPKHSEMHLVDAILVLE